MANKLQKYYHLLKVNVNILSKLYFKNYYVINFYKVDSIYYFSISFLMKLNKIHQLFVKLHPFCRFLRKIIDEENDQPKFYTKKLHTFSNHYDY